MDLCKDKLKLLLELFVLEWVLIKKILDMLST
jgi:hypothetical protein